MKTKSPAFRFYPADFLMDEKVRLMSLQEKGAYIVLLCHCWVEKSVPADVEELASLCNIDARDFESIWKRVSKCFKKRGNRLINNRLQIERHRQAVFSHKQQQNAKKRSVLDGAMAEPKQSQTAAKSSLSLSLSSSSSFSVKNDRTTIVRGTGAPLPDKPKAAYQEAVDHLCETYKAGPGKGQRYPFNGTDGKAVKRIVGNYGLATFKALWDEFLARDWKWIDAMNKTVNPPRDLRFFETKLPWLLEDGKYKSRLENIGPTAGLPAVKLKTLADAL